MNKKEAKIRRTPTAPPNIRAIAKCFESTFNIDLGNFYQTYLELRTRKMNPTKFLDALREGLIRKMDEQDG